MSHQASMKRTAQKFCRRVTFGVGLATLKAVVIRHAMLVAVLVASSAGAAQSPDPLPGMPPLIDPHDVYAAARPGRLSPVVRSFPERVYVPNSGRNTVDVIDPHTFKIIDHFPVGRQPQHITPSYDLRTLFVLNDLGDSLTRIDPATGHVLDTIAIKDP